MTHLKRKGQTAPHHHPSQTTPSISQLQCILILYNIWEQKKPHGTCMPGARDRYIEDALGITPTHNNEITWTPAPEDYMVYGTCSCCCTSTHKYRAGCWDRPPTLQLGLRSGSRESRLGSRQLSVDRCSTRPPDRTPRFFVHASDHSRLPVWRNAFTHRIPYRNPNTCASCPWWGNNFWKKHLKTISSQMVHCKTKEKPRENQDNKNIIPGMFEFKLRIYARQGFLLILKK